MYRGSLRKAQNIAWVPRKYIDYFSHTGRYRPPPFPPRPVLAVLGTSLGVGIVVYQIGKSATERGLARIEIGRSQFRCAANPTFLHSVLPSLKNLVIMEFPLYYNMSAVMGLSRFDSDDDDESNMRSLYMLDWKPEARLL